MDLIQIRSVKKTNNLQNKIIICICGLSLIIMGVLFVKEDSIGSLNTEKFLKIKVTEGDTLWSLAKTHNQLKEDIRSVVYRIKKINDLKTAEIYPGQTILIPTR